MIHTRSGAAANRRGSASGACQTLSCLLEDPLPGPRGVKERSSSQLWISKQGCCPQHGSPKKLLSRGPLLRISSLSQSENFMLPKNCLQNNPAGLLLPYPSSLAPARGRTREKKKTLGWGREEVLFLCRDPAPSQCQRAVLDESRNQGQGPSPGPRRATALRPKSKAGDQGSSHPHLADYK